MTKSFLTSAAIAALLLGAAPAFADCTSSIKSTDAIVVKVTDSTKKTAAMKHMALAREKMAAKDEAGCMMHVNEAIRSST
jgi:hypothetical protein